MPHTRSFVSLAPLALTSIVLAQSPLTPGNLVVVRVGTGAAALSSAANATFLDEFSTAGTLVQTLAMPTAVSGSNAACTNGGTATSEGHLNLSNDGRYLTLAGYNCAPSTASPSGTTSATVARVVARVGMDGVIDTSTQIGNTFSAGTVRSAVTDNGSQFWVCGSNSGVQYVALGTTTAAAASSGTPTNLRDLGIYNGQVYCSSASGTYLGVSTVGTGSPTTAQPITLLPGFPTTTGPSSYDFFFADTNTVYVADDRAAASSGGIQKWTLSGGIWTLAYTIPSTNGVRYLTGVVNAGVVTLYGTTTTASANSVITVTDTGAGSTVTTLATAPTNTAFRGIRLLRPRGAVWFKGAGSPTTIGIPGIASSGNAVIGNAGFTVNCSNLPPSSFGFLALGLGYLQSTGTPVPGAPSTFNLYLTVASTNLLLADGSGNASKSLPLPNNTALLGLPLATQMIAYDAALPDALPLGASTGMQVVLGL